MKILQHAEQELLRICQQKATLILHIMDTMLAFFSCTGAQGRFMNHERSRKRRKYQGKSTLEICSYKKWN